MLELKNIKKIYKDGSIGVKNANIVLPNKGFVLLVGKSGSGKSTILNLISGIMRPTEGEILYNGVNIKDVKNYKNIIGNVFQDYNLIRDLSVIDNINLISQTHTHELMDKLGIDELKNKHISEISGGEARRVAILRSLNKDVKILLCDEPTESLDEENATNILNMLKEISKNILVIVVSHKNTIVDYADRIITVSKCELVSDEVKCEDNSKVNENSIKTRVSLFKLIKIGLYRILHNFGLFSLNLSSMFLFLSLLILSLVLKSTDLAKLEVDEMLKSNSYKINVECLNSYTCESKVKKVTDNYNQVYEYSVEGDLLKFQLNRADTHEEIGAFYSSYINFPAVIHIGKNTFLESDEIVGDLPKKANEILISEYAFEGFKKFGVKTSTGDFKKYNEVEEVIGSELILGNKPVIITGVLRQDIDTYNGFKDIIFLERLNQHNYYSMFDNSVISNNYIYVKDSFDGYIEYKNKYLKGFHINTNDQNILYQVKRNLNSEDGYARGKYSGILGKYQVLLDRLKVFANILLVCLIIFASIFLFNYFSNSIENHEKDNRIFKYLGVSNFGIFIPYLIAIILLITISFVGSVIVFNIVSNTLNNMYYSILSNEITIFRLTLNNIITVFSYLSLIIFILSLISIFKINKSIKKYTE